MSHIVHIDFDTLLTSLYETNDNENVGQILRSVMFSNVKIGTKNHRKLYYKFITKYCPSILQEPEVLIGLSESWRLKDLYKMVKKEYKKPKEQFELIKKYVFNELIDLSSDENMKYLLKQSLKWSLVEWKQIILIVMMAHDCARGWEVIEKISSCWVDERLHDLLQLILDDDEFIDMAEGKDGGLFSYFPSFKNKLIVHKDMRDEDTEGSLKDFIVNDDEEIEEDDDEIDDGEDIKEEDEDIKEEEDDTDIKEEDEDIKEEEDDTDIKGKDEDIKEEDENNPQIDNTKTSKPHQIQDNYYSSSSSDEDNNDDYLDTIDNMIASKISKSKKRLVKNTNVSANDIHENKISTIDLSIQELSSNEDLNEQILYKRTPKNGSKGRLIAKRSFRTIESDSDSQVTADESDNSVEYISTSETKNKGTNLSPNTQMNTISSVSSLDKSPLKKNNAILLGKPKKLSIPTIVNNENTKKTEKRNVTQKKKSSKR
ncbi:hypothetical protein WA158_000931 [Blastocystis sp. Blastoise]